MSFFKHTLEIVAIEVLALVELGWPDWAIDVWFAVHD